MYRPDFCLRLEIDETDIDTIWAWHVIVGGHQRGGIAVKHGYLHVPTVWIEEDFSELLESMKEELIRQALRVTHLQLTLGPPEG